MLKHVSAILAIQITRNGHEHLIRFVHPIVTAMIAACTLRRGERPELIRFSSDAGGYAENVGLIETIRGNYSFPQPGGRHGRTYSRLVKLASHAEVDASNEVIGRFFREQIAETSPQASRQLTRVVGELHDNIASHAGGAGFSCAQVYSLGDEKRIEFAVADVGCGMLANVQRIDKHVSEHEKAIEWCLVRGNTTSADPDEWAQRLPPDALCSPYPSHCWGT